MFKLDGKKALITGATGGIGSEIAKTLEMGPKPIEGDTRKLGKRKKILDIIKK